MSLTGFKQVFPVGNQEYAYNVYPIAGASYNTSIEISIPKITGNITSIGQENIQTYNLFQNDPTCMPVFATTVNKKNTITALVEKNVNWLNKFDSSGTVPAGSQFVVEFLNGNLNSAYISTK